MIHAADDRLHYQSFNLAVSGHSAAFCLTNLPFLGIISVFTWLGKLEFSSLPLKSPSRQRDKHQRLQARCVLSWAFLFPALQACNGDEKKTQNWHSSADRKDWALSGATVPQCAAWSVGNGEGRASLCNSPICYFGPFHWIMFIELCKILGVTLICSWKSLTWRRLNLSFLNLLMHPLLILALSLFYFIILCASCSKFSVRRNYSRHLQCACTGKEHLIAAICCWW